MAIRKYIIIVFIGSLNVLSAQYEGMSATPKDTVKPAVSPTPAAVPTVRVITPTPSPPKNAYENFNNTSLSRPATKQKY